MVIAFSLKGDYNAGVMGGERLGPPVTETTYTPEGDKVVTTKRSARYFLDLPSFDPKKVSIHEALHAVGAELTGTPVLHASIEPDSTSLGRTVTAGPNATAAAAAHAFGCDGTDWDMHIVDVLGEKGATGAAKNVISRGNGIEKVKAVAGALERSGSISGNGAREAMASVDKADAFNKEGITVFDIFVHTAKGEVISKKDIRTKESEVKDPIDLLPGKVVHLKKRKIVHGNTNEFALAA